MISFILLHHIIQAYLLHLSDLVSQLLLSRIKRCTQLVHPSGHLLYSDLR